MGRGLGMAVRRGGWPVAAMVLLLAAGCLVGDSPPMSAAECAAAHPPIGRGTGPTMVVEAFTGPILSPAREKFVMEQLACGASPASLGMQPNGPTPSPRLTGMAGWNAAIQQQAASSGKNGQPLPVTGAVTPSP